MEKENRIKKNKKMTECKACGKDIAKGAKKCPNCGKDQRSFFGKHKILTVILVFVLIATVPALIGSSDDEEKKNNEPPVALKEKETETEEEAEEVETEEVEEVEEIETEKVEEVVGTKYKSGKYKVGDDLPEGEYVLIPKGRSAYVELSSDSTGDFESIIANDNFSNSGIITVEEGEYLKVQGADFYEIGTEPELDTSEEGHFKVGTHIPAGEYKVIDLGSGYIEVSSNSRGSMYDIISNDNLDGDSYITIEDGQYLKLNRAKLD